MGIWKRPVMVRLDEPEAEWIDQAAMLAGSRSAALRLVVRTMHHLYIAGIVDWKLAVVQQIQRNRYSVIKPKP